jgi:hypothetical protein
LADYGTLIWIYIIFPKVFAEASIFQVETADISIPQASVLYRSEGINKFARPGPKKLWPQSPHVIGFIVRPTKRTIPG